MQGIQSRETTCCTLGSNPVLVRKQSTGKEQLLAKDKSSDLVHRDEFYLLPGEDSLQFSVDMPSTTTSTTTTTTSASASASSATLTTESSGKKRKMPSTFVEGEGEAATKNKEEEEETTGAAAAKPAAKKKPKVEEEADERQQQKKKVDTRPKCMYGKACYRKNADHLKAFSHVFDDDGVEQTPATKKKTTNPAGATKKWEPEKELDDDEDEGSILLPPEDNSIEVKMLTKHNASTDGEARVVSSRIGRISYATPPKMRWTCVEGTLFVLNGVDVKPSAKIASFDMDSTLIVTKSGRVFPQSRTDWQWMYSSIPDALRRLHRSGFKIVIFTNQGGIKKSEAKADEIKGKIWDLWEDLGVPIQAFIAGGGDSWRKPSTDMWDFMCRHCNGGVAVDMESSFYCGDAAGRSADPTQGRPKRDFSCGDRKFAANIGVNFHTPEAYFLKQKEAEFEWGGVNPKSLYLAAQKHSLIEGVKGKSVKVASDTQELVVFVGFPASGKSTFAERYFVPEGYVRVNQDMLKSKDRCLRACAQALDEGSSVVIDNTNPSPAVRAEYLALAKKRGLPARCFYFATSKDVAKHLNHFRERLTDGERRHVPDMGYNIYAKNFKEPKPSEGFTEVKKINFVPRFDSKLEERLFLQFTAD
ncbi:DNA 3'phosphatase [Acanthamoeba castellanii str. Neff]|uniref:DNA 3'phosphatase n=1 Tax=Acanthamoeba castellanii (strain ATCC 30010 / Neff) TaxID=1257118 RepID=L8GQE4_ACACF|nr:DNA 3'phosphatase [Acanthamoeba castellanii str. Neff]ELR14356.1 DNA 3'phosphatase [Acanthamoeba castellanii str. Neff]